MVIVNAVHGEWFAFYVFRNGEKVFVENYRSDNFFCYAVNDPGEYYCTCFVKDKDGAMTTVQTRKVIFEV